MRQNIVKLVDASDITRRKRQQGTSTRYNQMWYNSTSNLPNSIPVGGIPYADMYDLAHVSAEYSDQVVPCLPCLNGGNSPWVLETYQIQYQNTNTDLLEGETTAVIGSGPFDRGFNIILQSRYGNTNQVNPLAALPVLTPNPSWDPADISSYPVDVSGTGTPTSTTLRVNNPPNGNTIIPVCGIPGFGPSIYNYQFIQFSGYYLAPETGNYTFVVNTDDVVYMTVGNTVIANAWTSSSIVVGPTIPLIAGKYYAMHIYYANRTGLASLNILVEKAGPNTFYPFGSQIFR